MESGEPLRPRAPRLFLDRADVADPDALARADAGDVVTIRGASVHRLGRVLRLRRGDALEAVFEDTRRVFALELVRLGADAVEARVESARATQDDTLPPVWLCPSVVRAPRFDTLVEKTTELGVYGIRPVRATRSLAQSQGRERMARWRRVVTEASEQCRRERRPILEAPVELPDLVNVPAPVGGLRLFASERERGRRIADVLPRGGPLPTSVEVLVGPEGGFTDTEASAAVEAGWAPVSLGPRPLRAETAAIVAIALVMEALRGDAAG